MVWTSTDVEKGARPAILEKVTWLKIKGKRRDRTIGKEEKGCIKWDKSAKKQINVDDKEVLDEGERIGHIIQAKDEKCRD